MKPRGDSDEENDGDTPRMSMPNSVRRSRRERYANSVLSNQAHMWDEGMK
jgi:hypothetical protein